MRFRAGFLLIFFSTFLWAQKDTKWYIFYNKDSSKIGYKDVDGNIKIPAKYSPSLASEDFDKVIAVIEHDENNDWKHFYINKNLKKFGQDSVYIFDYTFANESEGKIKFRDRKTDNVGYFDIDGKVVIPAKYNDAHDFHNGIAIVREGGEKRCENNKEYNVNDPGCEHWSYVGATTYAINTKNQKLFEIQEDVSFYSALDIDNPKINDKNINPNFYKTYQGSDGNSYSYLIPEKEFQQWFDQVFMADFKKNKTVLPKYYYDYISVDDNNDQKYDTAWSNHQKTKFLSRNSKYVDKDFAKVLSKQFDLNPSWEKEMNNLYFPENIKADPKLRENIVISCLVRSSKDSSGHNSYQFTKIGNSFYITSVPNFSGNR